MESDKYTSAINNTEEFIKSNTNKLLEARTFVEEQKLKISTIWEDSKKIYRYLADVKIMVVTANQIECETLFAFFAEDSGYDLVKIGLGDVVYTFFKINECRVVHIEPTNIGAYSRGGTAETISNAVKVAKPNVILSLGVGFGADPKKNHLGDVMVGRQHFSYDKSAKAVKDGLTIKVLHVEEPDNYMLSRFKSNINTEDHMTGTLLGSTFDILLGNMVTGEFVVDSENFMSMILKPFELFGIIGGEMEAYGIFEEIKRSKYCILSNEIPHCIMAKGICDWGIGKNDAKKNDVEKNDIQRYAMINACEVCRKFLNSREMFSDLRTRGFRKRMRSWLNNKGIKSKGMRVKF